jgi:glycosyltransferase-like protein
MIPSNPTGLPVVLVTYSTKPRGGVVHTLELADALQRISEPVRLVALGDPERGFFRASTVPQTIVRAPQPAASLEERVADSLEALVAGLAPFAEEPCILHTQDCIAARAACRVRDQGAPVVVVRTVHHVDDFTTPALVDCQRLAITEPDHLLVVSRYWQRRLRDDFGVSADLVTNGVDVARFSRPSAIDPGELRARAGLEDRFIFLTVGGIEPRKGSAVLIEALGRLRHSCDVPPALVVVGGHSFQDHSAYRHQVLERAEAIGLATGRDLAILGTVSDDEVTSWYRAADAFVFPSINEGWGLAVLEALAAGIPVITSDIAVFREYLGPDTAMLVPSGDAAALEAAMRQMMDDPELRRRLASAGGTLATHYTWDACARRHRVIYRDLRAARGAGVA